MPSAAPVTAMTANANSYALAPFEKNKKKPGDDLLSHHEGSTIGVEELNFRVRNGNGCGLFTIVTRQI